MKTYNQLAAEAKSFGLTAIAVHSPKLGLTILAGDRVLGEAMTHDEAEGLLYSYSEYVSGRGCSTGNCEV